MFFQVWIVVFSYQIGNSFSIESNAVISKNDCFERVALEAMLPFNSTFRNDDINFLDKCKELCLREGERCQTIAFGISFRGNGTCQLASHKIDTSRIRPRGTIYDPDFNLFERKNNCFDIPMDNHIIPLTTGGVRLLTKDPNLNPSSSSTTTKVTNSISNVPPHSTFITPINGMNTYSTIGETLHVTETKYPGNSGSIETQPDIILQNNNPNGDKFYFNQNIDRLYTPPILYETNYPAPNDPTGSTFFYATNIPTNTDTYRPYNTQNSDQTHIINLDNNSPQYINDFTYDQTTGGYTVKPIPTSSTPLLSPIYTYNNNNNMGTIGNNNFMPNPDPLLGTRPTNNNFTDSLNRPDPLYGPIMTLSTNSQTGGIYIPPTITTTTTIHNPYNITQNNNLRPNIIPPSTWRPVSKPWKKGNYPSTTPKIIETYFNPEDYLHTTLYKSCFRRSLAGMRVAPQWVRRTLSCERIEDCMTECGHEKRFTCEGFNYHLDSSGHGECQMIEVPLSQMDLYSSQSNRDTNLELHPDCDYYERDRNAPSRCRPTSCIDCNNKPYIDKWDHRPNYRPNDKPFQQEYYIGDRYHPTDTKIEKYHPVIRPTYEPTPNYYSYESHSTRPPYSAIDEETDRYDSNLNDEYKPNYWNTNIPVSHQNDYTIHESFEQHHNSRPDRYRPAYRPGPNYSPYRLQLESQHHHHHHPKRPYHSEYLDRDRSEYNKKPFIPYLIDDDDNWDIPSSRYGGRPNSKNFQHWSFNENYSKRGPPDFNYLDLGDGHKYDNYDENYIWNYPGSRYGEPTSVEIKDRPNYGDQWTRRPGPDECSVKTSEGFRLHKGIIRQSHIAPSVTDCERLCTNANGYICHTYSYRYTTDTRENCLLCDRPFNLLDYYVDIEPDRNYDIYSMGDDIQTCKQRLDSTAVVDPNRSTQCFFRAIDASRFYKSIVRDSLTVHSIGECEIECIKSAKFTCRAFAFRYGQRTQNGIIDNCQLSDWPVLDMDKEKHFILDPSFDVYERASYGHGCEIQPIIDEKHKKLCYLGYGSPAKLLSTAIKKVISVPSEVECKNECTRLRETSPFKCFSFSYALHASTFNCEMSDLDQSELKLNIHYSHTRDRDYWLFAWNQFDWTCRDKITTIGGNRINNDRRMDVFREPGKIAWRHFTVSGKPCRLGSECEKNLITGFHSCETDGGEVGSWDYCCKTDHPCGYSQGFEYPWCYVGDEIDQWRKCSDRYYPGNNISESQISVAYIHKDKKQKNPKLPEKPQLQQEEGRRNLSDFTAARLWPVTYLYSHGPPNSTEFSNFVDCNKENC